MATEDVPSLKDVLVASSEVPRVTGFYPGSGPDGSGETDVPDGPFKQISPMMFSVDHRQLPAYVLDTVLQAESQAGKADPEALEKALLKELSAMGVDPAALSLGEASTPNRGLAAAGQDQGDEAKPPSEGAPKREGVTKGVVAPGKDSTPSAE